MKDQYLSVTQVAEQKQVSRNAVYKAISQRRLSATEIAGFVVVRVQDAAAWQPKARTGRRSGSPMSDKTKARIADAQRLRWQRKKQE